MQIFLLVRKSQTRKFLGSFRKFARKKAVLLIQIRIGLPIILFFTNVSIYFRLQIAM